jgi:hypothetical protein
LRIGLALPHQQSKPPDEAGVDHKHDQLLRGNSDLQPTGPDTSASRMRRPVRISLCGRDLLANHRCRAGRHHQHFVAGAEHFVIEIHANDGVGAEFPRAILQLGNRQVASPGEFFLIGRGAAAHKIADAGKQILEQVGAEYVGVRLRTWMLLLFLPKLGARAHIKVCGSTIRAVRSEEECFPVGRNIRMDIKRSTVDRPAQIDRL